MTTATENVSEIIGIVGPLISTVLMPYLAWRMGQIEKNTNSKMDKVIEQTARNSEQVGKEKEQDAQKERKDEGGPRDG